MKRLWFSLALLPLWATVLLRPPVQTERPVVYAVLFYSPACGHCHHVITEVLPPLLQRYGDQLKIVGVDVTQPNGRTLFDATLQYFTVEQPAVPLLVVGERYLVGSFDIPEQFPGLIDTYLAQGGAGWPAIPGLAEAMAGVLPTNTPQTAPTDPQSETAVTIQPTAGAGASGGSEPTPPSAATQSESATPAAEGSSADPATPLAANATPAEAAPTNTPGIIVAGDQTGSMGITFGRDLAGNSLAVLVLAAMVLSIGGAGFYFARSPAKDKGVVSPVDRWSWLVPLLCVVGLAVAGYLAYVETAQVEAVCGPVGDCNTVQQSEYARLFGILPIGVLGIAGYLVILLVWGVGRIVGGVVQTYAALVILGLAIFGVLFSIYLTFLEPFVIGATCAWCLTSAVIMTVLFWLSLGPARRAIVALQATPKNTI